MQQSCHSTENQEFPTVFDGNIRSMDGKEFHIHLTDDAKPFYQDPFLMSNLNCYKHNT